MLRKLILPFWIASLILFSSYSFAEVVTNFEQVITTQYPGFTILKPADFSLRVQKSITSPAIIVGDFNGDGRRDFAALIRTPNKKKMDVASRSFSYYDSKLVICYQLEERKFFCKDLTAMPVSLPYDEHLQLITPGETVCYERHWHGNRLVYNLNVDSIATIARGATTMQWMRSADDDFEVCASQINKIKASSCAECDRLIKKKWHKPKRHLPQ